MSVINRVSELADLRRVVGRRVRLLEDVDGLRAGAEGVVVRHWRPDLAWRLYGIDREGIEVAWDGPGPGNDGGTPAPPPTRDELKLLEVLDPIGPCWCGACGRLLAPSDVMLGTCPANRCGVDLVHVVLDGEAARRIREEGAR